MTTFVKFIDDRHDLRKKYFETDGYYKWSDIIDDNSYKRRRDACFIRSIIAGTHKNWDSDFTRIMDNHINDQKSIGEPSLIIYMTHLKSYQMTNTVSKMKFYNFSQC